MCFITKKQLQGLHLCSIYSEVMKNSIAATLLFVLLLSVGTVNAQNENQSHRLIIQLVNGDSLSQFGLMKNLSNLTRGWPELEIEVVCHGPGLFLLHKEKSRYPSRVSYFSDEGVQFVACENTMKAKNVERAEILDVASFVPMGIKEIILKQEAGWSYIKAGVVK